MTNPTISRMSGRQSRNAVVDRWRASRRMLEARRAGARWSGIASIGMLLLPSAIGVVSNRRKWSD